MPGQRSGREALPRAVSDRENRKRVLVYDRNWGVLVTNVDEIVCGCWNGGEYQSCKGSGQPRPGGLQGSQAYPADDLSRRAQPLRLPAAPVPGNPAGVAIDGDPRRATGVSNSGRGPSPATGSAEALMICSRPRLTAASTVKRTTLFCSKQRLRQAAVCWL